MDPRDYIHIEDECSCSIIAVLVKLILELTVNIDNCLKGNCSAVHS